MCNGVTSLQQNLEEGCQKARFGEYHSSTCWNGGVKQSGVEH